MKVIIDTNGLMAQGQFGVDVFDELGRLGYDECVLPSAVVDELKALEKKVRGADRVALAVAKSLARRCQVVEAPGEADGAIVELAKKLHAPVFTNDSELRKRLKNEGIKTIYMRSKHKLESDHM
ncbi:PIN domain-containing protein [Methanocella conradii]|uniref:type II toxin-antitoxin system VapC family toxin n=1 Tax=Methanocella conradii TaxID=1175444 RepID=UPI0024B32899|nr:PIN domain-containing protein [Methanocella conradii]MDI6897165.1 DNA-binding protein [Methanocella conradii]